MRVKKLEKKKRSKSSGLKRLMKVSTSQRVESFIETVMGANKDASKQGGIKEIDVDEVITLVDMETKVDLGAELQGRFKEKDEVNVADKEVNAGMTYAQVRPIFEKEYNKVQNFLKFNIDKEHIKKRVAKETLLQESFKKLRAKVKVSGSHPTQDTPIDDPKEMSEEDVKNMLEIILVAELKVEAL
nr:hypothetical protein [Tanacetum cinerariifolium]